MAKLKIENVLSFLSSEFGNPQEIKDYSEYLKNESLPEVESGDYSTYWEKLIRVKNVLKDKDISLEQYIAGMSNVSEKKTRTRGPKVLPSTLLEIDCWSNKLYNAAYDIVKDRLFPIVVPSYNRPDCKFIEWYCNNITPGYEYPVYLVVRQSQKDAYLNNEYVKMYDFINVKAFPDELIDNLGKTREQIVNVFSKKFDNIFMFDDDVVNICHTVPFVRNNGEPKAQGVMSKDAGKTLAMWQLATEYAIKKYDVIMTKPMPQGFSWVPGFIDVNSSIRILSGLPSQAVCVNLKKLMNEGLNYRTSIGHGHEDYDLLFRCLEKGLVHAEFRWMTYGSPSMTSNFVNNSDTIQQRFRRQQQEMYDNFKHLEWLRFSQVRGLDNVKINWNKYLQEYKEKGFGDYSKNRQFDIWRNGQLLEDAKNNFQ